jgi:PAS domain S-box-containing protein
LSRPTSPTFEDIFAVMAAASVGDLAARVAMPAEPDLEHIETRFAIALNILLEDLAASSRRRVEDRFRGVMESAPDALVVVTIASNTIVQVNAQTEKMFAQSREELVGKPLSAIVPAGLLGTEGLCPNGTKIPIEISVSPLRLDDGDALVVAAIRNITDRMKSEEQRSRLAAIVDSSDDAMISKTLDGTITTWNHGAQQLLGYTAEEIVGKSIYLLVPPGREAEENTILRSLALGAVMHLDTVRRHKDGTEIEVSITVSPVRDETGKVVAVSDVERDITDRVRVARVLAQAKDEAEAANQELKTFSYSVAHDLRAPLRGMNGFASLLLDEYRDKLDARARGWLDGIQRNATRMAELIDGLLSLARVTQAELSPTTLDLNALARETLAQLAASEPDRNVAIEIQDGLSAHADSRLVRVLFANLFSNAWKFTSKTSDARIELGVANGELFVRDNGVGFDPAFANKLFQPFRRLHDPNEFPGTGVGLATVQRIVHRHGGSIRAHGTVGGGATFFFTLAAPAAVPG